MAKDVSREDDRIGRWARWVEMLEARALDAYEYLGAVEKRDEVELWLQVSGNQRAMDTVADIDAGFEAITEMDGAFALRFAHQAGSGWWWNRVTSDPGTRSYLFENQ